MFSVHIVATYGSLCLLRCSVPHVAVQRNYDPALHPLEAPREYTRAVNAVKLDRVFAKPFLGSLDGHTEGISVVAKKPNSLSTIASGAFDGEVTFYCYKLR